MIVILDRDILSPTMKYVLLPAYTKFICSYTGLSKTGQTRIPLDCSRAIRPDGVNILLTGMSGGDVSGKSGLIGKIDNRFMTQYGGAFLLAGISAMSGVMSKKQNGRI